MESNLFQNRRLTLPSPKAGLPRRLALPSRGGIGSVLSFAGLKKEEGLLALAPPSSTGPLGSIRAHVARRLTLLATATRSCGALAPPQPPRRKGS